MKRQYLIHGENTYCTILCVILTDKTFCFFNQNVALSTRNDAVRFYMKKR